MDLKNYYMYLYFWGGVGEGNPKGVNNRKHVRTILDTVTFRTTDTGFRSFIDKLLTIVI